MNRKSARERLNPNYTIMKTTTPYSEGKYICTSCNNVSDTYSITCRCVRENLTSPKHGETLL